MAQSDALRTLRARREKHLGGRRVRIFLEKMVLDLPGIIDAEAVGELHLIERLLVNAVLVTRLPGPRNLMFVKNAEFHSGLRFPLMPPHAARARRTWRGASSRREGREAARRWRRAFACARGRRSSPHATAPSPPRSDRGRHCRRRD